MSGIQSIRNGLTGNITKIIVVAIIITFIGSVGWAGFFSQGSANIIAKVGSQEITAADLSFEASTQQFSLNQRFPGQEIEEDVIINLSKEVLIDKFSILDFLYKNNIYLTDGFVYKALSDEEQFQENGRFSKNRFDSFARSNGFIPSDYLKRVKEDFLLSIWNQSIAASSFVIDDDINESIQLAEQLRDITFIKIPRIKFEEKIILEDEDLQNYYDLNKASFTSPEKAKITYTILDSEDIKEDIFISDEEIDSEYQDYSNNFDRTKRKSVSHIMLNIDDSRTSDDALQEIEKIKNEFDTGKSFEELALEHSEDGGTKDLGGSLGITDGTLLPPEFEEALLDMVVGETRSIELMTSIHLLKLDEIIQPEPESIEERSEQIIDTLTSIKAEELYVELLDEVSNMAFTSSDIQNISKNLDLDVVETDFVTKNELPESLQSQNLIDYIFQDSFESNFPEIIELSELSAVLIQVTDYLEEKQLSFPEVKSQIQNVYLAEEIMKASKEFGENSVSELQNGLEISELSIQQGQTLENYKGIKRDSSLLPIQAVNQIFTLPKSKSGEAFGYSIAQNGDTFIFRLDDVTPGSVSVTDEEKQSITDFLSQQKITSELAELQVYLEDSLSVQKLN